MTRAGMAKRVWPDVIEDRDGWSRNFFPRDLQVQLPFLSHWFV